MADVLHRQSIRRSDSSWRLAPGEMVVKIVTGVSDEHGDDSYVDTVGG